MHLRLKGESWREGKHGQVSQRSHFLLEAYGKFLSHTGQEAKQEFTGNQSFGLIELKRQKQEFKT